MNYQPWKRILDLALVSGSLLIAVPLGLVVAAFVRSRLGRPVLFRQERAGWMGRPFVLVKFRTMTDARDTDGVLLPDADRLTSFGRWLRRTSLDELPTLWNVLRGDMSFVGPRPLPVRYLPRYSPAQARRHEVRPGITGLAQVNGRNERTWEEKFAIDLEYVNHASLLLDLRILIRTLVVVLRQSGVNQSGHATAEEFQGTPRTHEFYGQ